MTMITMDADAQLWREQAHHALVEGMATKIARALRKGVEARGIASLAVCGGRTPAPLFERLARADVPWSSVQITLTDERCVPLDHPESNEAMVRRMLVQGPARAATLVGLHGDLPAGAAQPEHAIAQLRKLPRPFDYVVLGMGEDGHFASLFPAQRSLQVGLDPNGQIPVVLGCGKGTDRVSLTLSTLLDTRNLALFITGDPKLAVLDRAKTSLGDDAEELPVRALLRQSRTPVQVQWAPAP